MPRINLVCMAIITLMVTSTVPTAAESTAAPIMVTNLLDHGPGSLRAALDAANASGGDDTIQFSASLSGTIDLSTTLVLSDTGSVTITGPGSKVITIAGNDTFRLMNATAPALNISGLGFAHGNNFDFGGGGLAYQGNALSLTNVAMDHNQADADGGALITSGKTIIVGSTFTNNEAGGAGGAVEALQDLTVLGSTFTNNSGFFGAGAIFANGPLTVAHGAFYSNVTSLLGNVGAIEALSDLTVDSSILIANKCAILYSAGTRGLITNSLFARNDCPQDGAAITVRDGASLTLTHVTLAANGTSSAAIAVLSGKLMLRNSIVASNTVGLSVTAGSAMIAGSWFFGNGANALGNLPSLAPIYTGDPRFVSPTQDNYHLRAGSPVIDAAPNIGVALDIDGDRRDARPDFGYDEFVTHAYLPAISN